MKFIGAMVITLLGAFLVALPFIGSYKLGGLDGWLITLVVVGVFLSICFGGALAALGIWWGNKK